MLLLPYLVTSVFIYIGILILMATLNDLLDSVTTLASKLDTHLAADKDFMDGTVLPPVVQDAVDTLDTAVKDMSAKL